jgi:hypothetical protein
VLPVCHVVFVHKPDDHPWRKLCEESREALLTVKSENFFAFVRFLAILWDMINQEITIGACHNTLGTFVW